MGAFRGDQSTHIAHSELIHVTRYIAIMVIYSRSRILPPSWDLNLGKLCHLVPANLSPYPTSLNTHCEDPTWRTRRQYHDSWHPPWGKKRFRLYNGRGQSSSQESAKP